MTSLENNICKKRKVFQPRNCHLDCIIFCVEMGWMAAISKITELLIIRFTYQISINFFSLWRVFAVECLIKNFVSDLVFEEGIRKSPEQQ